MKILKNRLFLIILLGFALRFPCVWWGELYNPGHNYFQPDEHQHLSLAIETMQLFDDSLFTDFKPNRLNTQGFATQLGILSMPLMWATNSDYRTLAVSGRMLSLIYGLLLIWLTYRIGLLLFRNENIALVGALFLAIFDLNVTYSHYGVPEIFHVFWAYFSVYLIVNFSRRAQVSDTFEVSDTLIPFAAAMCLTAKYDFIPILIFGIISFLLFKKRIKHLFKIWVIFGVSVILFFEIGIAFQNETLIKSFQWLVEENSNLIGNDNHLLLNPILYLIGGVCGTSLVVFGFSVWGFQELVWGIVPPLKRWVRELALTYRFIGGTHHELSPWLPFALFILFEFIILWNLDAPFVRRINIFLPTIALFAAFGIFKSFQNAKKRRIALYATLIYTFGLTILNQANFIKDTRYEAKRFFEKQAIENSKIYYCPYSKMKGLPKGISKIEKAEYLVIHESYYRRYWKSFTTPFGIPKCCEGVYHCASEKECLNFQELLKGGSHFKLIQKFETFDIFPERIFYKKFFGTYETFLGDVLIFQHIKQ